MCSYTVWNTMATIYIICFGFEKKTYILSTHNVCTFRMIITIFRIYFPCSMNTGWFLRFVSRIFHYYFRLEIEASLAHTLLRHASHYTFPIFITPVEHLALKTNKFWNSQLDKNSAVLCQVAAVTNEAFVLTFNVQWLAVCEQSTQIYKTGNLRIKLHEFALA